MDSTKRSRSAQEGLAGLHPLVGHQVTAVVGFEVGNQRGLGYGPDKYKYRVHLLFGDLGRGFEDHTFFQLDFGLDDFFGEHPAIGVVAVPATQLALEHAEGLAGLAQVPGVVEDGLLDLNATVAFEAHPGIDQEWADLGIKSNVRGRPSLTDADFKELIPKASLRLRLQNRFRSGTIPPP